jgi:hypothetical protein
MKTWWLSGGWVGLVTGNDLPKQAGQELLNLNPKNAENQMRDSPEGKIYFG